MKKYEFTGETIMDDLKPCPFCGGTNDQVLNRLDEQPEMELVGLSENNWNVLCNECYALGGTRRTAVKAIEAWNRRVGEEEQDGV